MRTQACYNSTDVMDYLICTLHSYLFLLHGSHMRLYIWCNKRKKARRSLRTARAFYELMII